MNTDPVNVLVIDDDDVVVESLQRAFRKLGIANACYTASDGVEALDLLRNANGASSIPKPYLILLDLNMPRMDGLEFLAEIRADPALQRSVVFVLTTSTAEQDKAKAYERNVAGYIIKSSLNNTMQNTLTMLDQYWKVVELPC